MSKDQPRKTVITEGLKDIASRSTIHGISNIVSAKSKIMKLLWSAAFLGCFALVVSQLVDIFTLYRSYPMKTTFKLEKNAEFPAITICNMKRYKQSLIDGVKGEALDIAVNQYKDKMGNFTPVDLVNFCFDNGTHCGFLDLLHNITRQFELGLGYYNLFVMCRQGQSSLTDLQCNEPFEWLSTQYGNCFTIEPSKKLANVYGLGGEIYMMINLEDYIEFFSLRSGVRVVVHDNGTLPLPFEEGVTIKGGEEAFISIKPTETQRLGKPHGICKSDLNFGGFKYTIKACMQICWERLLLGECGCMNEKEVESIIFRTPEVRPPDCSLKTELFECFDKIKGNFINNPGVYCDCPVACSEHIYEMQVSSSKAFDIANTESSAELEGYSKATCDIFHNAPYLGGCPLDGYFLETNFVKLHFYLRDPLHETRQEEPLYSETEMMADIGGSLGLFIGASVLSLGELIEILGVCWRLFCRKRNTTTRINADDDQNWVDKKY